MTTIYQQVGKFQIERWLDRGGMANVYLARDTTTAQQVALKLLEIGADHDSQLTLAAERHGAILQSRLCGIVPHVATVFEYGESDRLFYIAMEYVEGDDLSNILRQGSLPVSRVIDVAIDICSVLVKAHGLQLTVDGEPHHGVIHGDIKPKNVRITPDGRVKVLDFGIAKALSLTRKLTRNDFGSVAYASPERLESGEVDVHSDLWSLAVVLYEMLSGQQPYREANTRRLEEVIRSRRLPASLPGDCPPGVQRVVARALAPTLARRYPSAIDFHADLVALRENRPTIADIDALPGSHDPDVTRRTTAPPPSVHAGDESAADATRRTVVPPGPVVPPLPSAHPPGVAAAPRATAAAKTPPRRFLGMRRPVRTLLLVGAIVIAFRESAVLDDAAELRSALPTKSRQEMDAVWSQFQGLANRSPLGLAVGGVKTPLKNRLVGVADHTIDAYRTDIAPIRERDWEEARRHLSRAMVIDDDDSRVEARLRYVEGHLHRINGDARVRRPQEARIFYNDAIVAFRGAARLRTNWPDPYLGLARVYFYGLDELEEGADALNAARRAGFKPGKRETAQRADGYRRRAERLWREAVAVYGLPQEDEVLDDAAEADREALALYQTIVGFGDASQHLARTQGHLHTIEMRLAEIRGLF